MMRTHFVTTSLCLGVVACAPDRDPGPAMMDPAKEMTPTEREPQPTTWAPYEAPAPIAAADQDWTPRMSEPIRVQPRYRPMHVEGPRLLAAKEAYPKKAFVFDAESNVRVDLAGPLTTPDVEIDGAWRYLAVRATRDGPSWTLFSLTNGSTVATFDNAAYLRWTQDGSALVGLTIDHELVAYEAPDFERRSLATGVAPFFNVTEKGIIAEKDYQQFYRSADETVARDLDGNVVHVSPDGRRVLLDRSIVDLDTGHTHVASDFGLAYYDDALTKAAYSVDGSLYAWREGEAPELVAEDHDGVAVARVADDGLVWAETPDGPHTVYRDLQGTRTQLARGVLDRAFDASASLQRVVYASRLERTEVVDGSEHIVLYDWDGYEAIGDELATLVLYNDEQTAFFDFTSQTVMPIESERAVRVQADAEGYVTGVVRYASRYIVDVYRGTQRIASLENVDRNSVEVRGGFVFARDGQDALYVLGADHDAPVKIADDVWSETVSGDWAYYVDRDDVLMARKLR
ncbi:MAG: hypothetical protein RMA76_20755 [Deltaproteobacteria bacterium]|jgi:hypothetical protein